ncbi:MAG: alpha-ribazole phosphatase family protein [Rhodocyclaceae bacterium]|nr:alpha-ribazole phosphatase family protein [Rhodocyclaceae bacterium]
MRLYLIRHPRPAVAPGICYGSTDLALAEDPAVHVAALRGLLPPGAPLYSSPLARCRLLAELVHPAPVFDDRLREIDFGDWEMRPWESIDRAALDAWAAAPLHYVPPGGESVAMLRARVMACLADLPDEAVLVTHAGVMKLCAALLAGVPTDAWLALSFDYGSVSLIESRRS